MHLLYLDESGHSQDPSTDFFVLAGFSIFERQCHWVDAAIEPIAARFNSQNSKEIELHGAPMRAGKDEWRQVSPADRAQATVDLLNVLANPQSGLRVFASVIEKKLMPADQILPTAFENVAREFDRHLGGMYLRKDPQRGLVVFDKTSYEQAIQGLSHIFKHQGHANGKLRNFAEVPLFIDSKASRLIQLADMIAYWIFRYYQSADERGYRLIERHIHREAGRRVGLTEQVSQATTNRLAAAQPHAQPFPQPTPLRPAQSALMALPATAA